MRRVFGLETEFGITCAVPSGRGLSAEEVAQYMFRPVVEWGQSSNVFLPNGSRLYLDIGSHPEYATAECDSVPQLIAYDRAGERIMAKLVQAAQEQLESEQIRGKVYCFKNNVDSAGNSFGCHENYLLRRTGVFERVTKTLVPHLITRQILVGAGAIRTTATGAQYCFSQRADHMWEAVSSATTRSRPIINTRDEPHADAEQYRRLHVIVGDSNMAEPTNLLKVGAMDILARMLDDGVVLTDLTLINPMMAIRKISHDLTGTAQVSMADGTQASALDIQSRYLEQVITYLDTAGASPVDQQVLDLWIRGLDAVRAQEPSRVERELDWAIKHRLLREYRARHGLELADPRLIRLELAYHDVNPATSAYYRMVTAGLINTVVSEAEINAAVEQPPVTTRAALRGAFVKAARAAGRDYSVDWLHLKVNEPGPQTVALLDPLAATNAEAAELIAALEAEQ